MINRSIHMIFESSGRPVPSAEEVQYEAREIVKRSGWGLPLIDRLHKVADPYWREAIARCLLEKWNELVRDKDEQTYYYDSDGDIRYCWMDAEPDLPYDGRARLPQPDEVLNPPWLCLPQMLGCIRRLSLDGEIFVDRFADRIQTGLA